MGDKSNKKKRKEANLLNQALDEKQHMEQLYMIQQQQRLDIINSQGEQKTEEEMEQEKNIGFI